MRLPVPAALTSRPRLVALISLGVDAAQVAVKLALGLLTGSLGLFGEAVHSLLDLASSTFAYFALRAAARPPDAEHPYGHGRAENLAAYTEGGLLLGTAAFIAYQAVQRLASTAVAVDARPVAIAVMGGVILVEVVRALVLLRVGRAADSAALGAAAQNRIADILTSTAVLAGLLGARAGIAAADSVAALVVAIVVARAAVLLLLRSGNILMDAAPSGVEHQVEGLIRAVPGIRDIRSVRVRRSGAHLLGDARVSARRTLSVEGAAALTLAVREAVASDHPNLELTVVIEADARAANLVERVHAAAARQEDVRDVHNVTVERETDGSLHIILHAKLPGDWTLGAASGTAAGLEAAIHAEFPDVSRVDVHLEPLEPNWVAGHDVTASRPDLVARLRSLVEGHPEVTNCRDIELSERDGGVFGHLVAEMAPDVSLEHAHAVETELEELVRARVGELRDVVARAAS